MSIFRKSRTARAFFDDEYYRRAYEDVADPDFDRFAHFMQHGWREGRNPSADFITLYYRDKYLGGLDCNPLEHYASAGRARRLTTKADDDEYLVLQRDVSSPYFSEPDFRGRTGYSGEDALGYYLRSGWRDHPSASFLFDGQHYLAAHRHIASLGISPLYHFASQRRLRGKAWSLNRVVSIAPPKGTLIAHYDAPSYAVSHPKLTELVAIPPPVLAVLAPLWRSRKIDGQPVKVYRFRDVFLAAEGLVFTSDGRLVEITRTHHSSLDICDATEAVVEALEKRPATVIERGILAESRGAGNYGHFVLEMLPRAWFARSRLKLDWPAIIHAGSAEMQTVARQALGCVGFPPEQVLAVGRDPVFVRELVFVEGLADHPCYLSPLVLQCYDETAAHVPDGSVRKLYAPRAPAVTRDFEDEPAAAAALAAAGFARMPTAAMPFEAQVALFRGAGEVVGVTGAALTNILFCRPGTRVLVFAPSAASEILFWMIAAVRGLAYEEVRCLAVGPQRGGLAWDRSIRIAADDVLRLARG